MGEAVELGKAVKKSATGIAVKPQNIEDRVAALENMIANIMAVNISSHNKPGARSSNAYENVPTNKDKIPIGISMIGLTKFGPRILTVAEGGYYVGTTMYSSLSAAAEAESGIIRKSGWVFWKLADGRTAKEAFKRT